MLSSHPPPVMKSQLRNRGYPQTGDTPRNFGKPGIPPWKPGIPPPQKTIGAFGTVFTIYPVQGMGYPQFTSRDVRAGGGGYPRYPQFTKSRVSPVSGGYPWFPRRGIPSLQALQAMPPWFTEGYPWFPMVYRIVEGGIPGFRKRTSFLCVGGGIPSFQWSYLTPTIIIHLQSMI